MGNSTGYKKLAKFYGNVKVQRRKQHKKREEQVFLPHHLFSEWVALMWCWCIKVGAQKTGFVLRHPQWHVMMQKMSMS